MAKNNLVCHNIREKIIKFNLCYLNKKSGRRMNRLTKKALEERPKKNSKPQWPEGFFDFEPVDIDFIPFQEDLIDDTDRDLFTTKRSKQH